MKPIYKIALILNSLCMGLNANFALTEKEPGLSIVACIIHAGALYYFFIELRKLSLLNQLEARLNPKKMETPINISILMEDKKIDILVTHYPGTITEGEFQLRIDETLRADFYVSQRLTHSIQLVNPPAND